MPVNKGKKKMKVKLILLVLALMFTASLVYARNGGHGHHKSGKKHKGHKFAHNPHYKKGAHHHGHSWKGKKWQGKTYKHFVYRGNWNGWSHQAFYRPLNSLIYWSPEDSVWYRKEIITQPSDKPGVQEAAGRPNPDKGEMVFTPIDGMTEELLDDGDEEETPTPKPPAPKPPMPKTPPN
jgi:hypothetical protein